MLIPSISLLASTINALFAVAVPVVAESTADNSDSENVELPTVNEPAIVTLAPLNVSAVVDDDPDLITNSPELFDNTPNDVPSSCKKISEPLASKLISVFAFKTQIQILI